VPAPRPLEPGDADALTEFLLSVDLTVSGIGEPQLQLWIEPNADGRIVGSTGLELGGSDALLRSVAVHPSLRGSGFEPADVGELSEALATTHQVRSFAESGQLSYEVAWSRSLL
jgi:hypothetical protein